MKLGLSDFDPADLVPMVTHHIGGQGMARGHSEYMKRLVRNALTSCSLLKSSCTVHSYHSHQHD